MIIYDIFNGQSQADATVLASHPTWNDHTPSAGLRKT
jgi:hypothetical protein